MKRSFLARLRSNGTSYIFSALLLLAGIPAYQTLVLAPTGYTNALTAASVGVQGVYIVWIGAHNLPFLIYRALLVLAFALLLSFPFSLFRIIVAQELMGQQEREEEEENDDDDDIEDGEEGMGDDVEIEDESDDQSGMPRYAWRGKGFAVIAAWSGMIGLVVYIAGTVMSTIYLTSISDNVANATLTGTNILLISIFAILTNTVGVGFLTLATLFFGATIARAGGRLWPSVWVYFGYGALAVAALLSGSAVGVASSPASGQAPLTAPAILLFALWILWLGIMLVRLKPEATVEA